MGKHFEMNDNNFIGFEEKIIFSYQKLNCCFFSILNKGFPQPRRVILSNHTFGCERLAYFQRF